MTPNEIHSQLRMRFGDTVADFVEPKAGDSFLTVSATALHDICLFLRDEPQLSFDFLRLITAVDFADRISSIYHLYSYKHQHSLVLRVDLSRQEPHLASVTDIWPGANWLEREAFDMVGVVYDGHPDLKRILLPLDWEGHPLRKDYQQPTEYHGVKHG